MGTGSNPPRFLFAIADLLIKGAALTGAPSVNGALSLIKGFYESWPRFAALGKKDKAVDTLGKKISSRLSVTLNPARRKYVEKGLSNEILDGVVTEVEIFLKESSNDGELIIAAVKDPDHFENLLISRAIKYRKNVDEKAKPYFDELVRTIAQEFISLTPGSFRFYDEVAKALLEKYDEEPEGIQNLNASTIKPESDISEIKNKGHFSQSRIRFGSRPMETAGFISRQEQTELVETIFSTTTPRTVLVGMHGCGKSQLAATIANQCIDKDWPLVAWINADSRQSIIGSLSELGLQMGVDTTDKRTPEILARRCLNVLESAEEAERLIVFDNVEHADDLKGLVPQGSGLRTLITTTKHLDWEQLNWKAIHIGVFEREQSIKILLERTDQTDHDNANAIAESLGDLPLALSQAAATIKRTQCDFSSYLNKLNVCSLEESVRRLDGDDYPEAVATALRLAFQSALEQIGKENSHWKRIASNLLDVLSLLKASGIPRRWLENTSIKSSSNLLLDSNEALNLLVEFSICQLSDSNDHKPKVGLHQLQSQVIRENWDSRQRKHAELHTVELLTSIDTNWLQNTANKDRRQDAIDLADQLHSLYKQDYSRNLFLHSDLGEIITSTLQYLTELGSPKTAISLSSVIEYIDKTFKSDRLDIIIDARNNLADAYRSAGLIDEAITIYKNNFNDNLRVLDRPHATLIYNNKLADAYRLSGLFDKAIPLYKRVIVDSIDIKGPEHPDTFTYRIYLACTYERAGYFNKGIDLFKKVITDSIITLKSGNQCIPVVLNALNGLACAYKSAERLGDATTLFEAVVDERTRILGRTHLDTLISRNNLAGAYASAGCLDKALKLYKEVIYDRIASLDPNHAALLASYNGLASTYQNAGYIAKPIGLFKEVVDERTRILGRTHLDTLASRNNLAGAYASAGCLNKAITLLEAVVTDSKCVLGPNHVQTLAFRNNLAGAYALAGRHIEAMTYYQEVRTNSLHKLGENHIQTLISRTGIANLYQSAGDIDRAIQMFVNLLTDCHKILGTNHPYTLTSRNNLAEAYKEAGRLDEAIPLYKENLSIALRALSPNHPYISSFRNNLADAYREAGNLDDAEALFASPADPDKTYTD